MDARILLPGAGKAGEWRPVVFIIFDNFFPKLLLLVGDFPPNITGSGIPTPTL